MQTETIRQAIKGGLENILEDPEKAEATFRKWEEEGTLERVMVEARQVVARAQADNPLEEPQEVAMVALTAYVNEELGMKL